MVDHDRIKAYYKATLNLIYAFFAGITKSSDYQPIGETDQKGRSKCSYQG